MSLFKDPTQSQKAFLAFSPVDQIKMNSCPLRFTYVLFYEEQAGVWQYYCEREHLAFAIFCETFFLKSLLPLFDCLFSSHLHQHFSQMIRILPFQPFMSIRLCDWESNAALNTDFMSYDWWDKCICPYVGGCVCSCVHTLYALCAPSQNYIPQPKDVILPSLGPVMYFVPLIAAAVQ